MRPSSIKDELTTQAVMRPLQSIFFAGTQSPNPDVSTSTWQLATSEIQIPEASLRNNHNLLKIQAYLDAVFDGNPGQSIEPGNSVIDVDYAAGSAGFIA